MYRGRSPHRVLCWMEKVGEETLAVASAQVSMRRPAVFYCAGKLTRVCA